MNKLQVGIFHSFDNNNEIQGIGFIDLDSGTVSDIVYENDLKNSPNKIKGYEFSYGIYKLDNKELEFTLEFNKDSLNVPTSDWTKQNN